MSWFVTYVMLRFVHYSDVTWATYAVSTHWQLDSLYISSFGLMSKETSMVQYGEESFFFNDSCLLLVQFYQLPPRYFFNFELPRSLPFLSNERKHQRYALLAICEWIPPMDSSYNAESVSISWCHHERCIMIIITTWYWDLIIFVSVVSMIIELRGFVYIYIYWIFMNNLVALQIHA